MLEEIIIAGFGGQGVMSMGQLLAYAGMEEDKHVSWIPAYGPEMRGGTANCSVTISDIPISSPIIGEPSTLIVLNGISLDKFQKSLQPGGLLLMNTSLITKKPNRSDVKVIGIPIDELALEKFGNGRVANMILLGAFIQITTAVSVDAVIGALKKVLPEYRHNLIPLNRQAIEFGMELAKNEVSFSTIA